MAKTDIHTPKGFRDILPELAQKRRKIINTIVLVLEKYDFVPIETPTAEFAETLTGKYGEEERLIYKFTDRGGRNLALRYDLTVPLARYVATYNPPLPFRRYQIGQVFRGENPQKGRWREFTQVDFDTVGSNDLAEDANVIACALKASKSLGLKTSKMLVNDKKNLFEKLEQIEIPEPKKIKVAREMDKIGKIPQNIIDINIISELSAKNSLASAVSASGTVSSYQDLNKPETANIIYNNLKNTNFPLTVKEISVNLQEAYKKENFKRFYEEPQFYKNLKKELQKFGIGDNEIMYDRNLVRGLDYYTGTIFELKPDENPASLSIGAGGRYNNLIGMFSKKDIPAVGFSFGLDRICEIVD
jgi:histidyl-tRNA synthetase